ncbi:uncharacterized protein LOC123669576 [Melitaea cinxia]|uniref:uncharacterized protein LOC123669576 n=1 Tax=Melitaea cinxia TaxID=113334 RepID=UPI001E2706B9|nr:uncharacterized protein LOC123669576 [Melitaea cinxia]
MAPPRKIIKRQLEILVDYLEENKDISGGAPFSPIGLHAAKVKWTIVAKKLNAVENGAQKSPDGWKKYWFEWRHKCRKKAANIQQNQLNSSGGSQKVTLNDIEVRALNINSKASVEPSIPAKKLEIFLSEDSDSEHQLRIVEDLDTKDMKPTKRRLMTENVTRVGTPPPEWAMDLEDRRIAAEERIAKALESIASMMRVQEERRSTIEERIVETLSSIADNLHALNCRVNQKNSLQQVQQINHEQTETSSMKDVIFL